MKSSLKIPLIEQYVHLGCSPEERRFKHRVHFAVQLFFFQPPDACISDKMDHTPCYAEIAELIGHACGNKEYATIEHLAQKNMDALIEYLQKFENLPLTKAIVDVHKVNPPVPVIKDGSIFTLEFEP